MHREGNRSLASASADGHQIARCTVAVTSCCFHAAAATLAVVTRCETVLEQLSALEAPTVAAMAWAAVARGTVLEVSRVLEHALRLGGMPAGRLPAH
jgi:hypothetical protein